MKIFFRNIFDNIDVMLVAYLIQIMKILCLPSFIIAKKKKFGTINLYFKDESSQSWKPTVIDRLRVPLWQRARRWPRIGHHLDLFPGYVPGYTGRYTYN